MEKSFWCLLFFVIYLSKWLSFFKFNFNFLNKISGFFTFCSKFFRRAKTRDEMYSYYCTFGEHRHPGHDFKSNIINILRDTLEGILTNSEVYYREIQQQNRHPTRPQSIKESYVEFADVMIIKLKSYMAQCDLYHNQCLKGTLFSVKFFNKQKVPYLKDF